MTGSVVPASRRYLRTQGTGHASFVALRLSQAVVTTDAVRVPPVATSMVTEGRQGILSQGRGSTRRPFAVPESDPRALACVRVRHRHSSSDPQLARGMSVADALRLGAAAGPLNATRRGLGTGTRQEIERLATHVTVRPQLAAVDEDETPRA